MKRRLAVHALILGVLFLAPSRLSAQCPDGSPPPCAGVRPSLPTVAVQPFISLSHDTAEAYRAWTLTEDITAALTASRAVRVLGGSLRARAEWQLSGSVRRNGDVVRYAGQLERRGEVRWSTRLEGPTSDESGLRDTLAARILAALGARQAVARPGPRAVDPVAYDLWNRGRYYRMRRREQDAAQGIALLRQAIARDSSFAAAWVDLARALDWARFFDFAVPGIPRDSLLAYQLAASDRALLLDSSSVDAWSVRADVARAVDPTSDDAALYALRRALALDSASAGSWDELAAALDEAGDTAAGGVAFRRALALDPDRNTGMLIYHHYWYGRQLDTAAALARRAVEIRPDIMFFRELQGEVAFARGQLEESRAAYEAALRLGSGREQVRALCGLAVTSAALGDTARARELVARAEAYVSARSLTNHDAIAIAGVYAALGESDRALDWLERYQPFTDLHFQQHLRDAPLDPLRSSPRFRRLITASTTP